MRTPEARKSMAGDVPNVVNALTDCTLRETPRNITKAKRAVTRIDVYGEIVAQELVHASCGCVLWRM
jgi:hypothetical protein